MLLAVSRVNESVPLFLLEGMRRRVGSLADRRVAVLGLAFKADTDDERDSLSHKLIRLLERELADVAVHDPHVATPTRLAAGRARRRRRGDRRHQPLRVPRRPSTLAAIAERAASDCLVVDPWNCWGAAQVFAYASELAALGSRRVSRVLVTGGAGTIGAAVVRRLLADPAYEVRVSDQRPAPHWMREGCEVHTGDLREPEQARAATRGCTHVIHLAAIVGGIANFHRLPHTLTEVNNALYNAVIRAALDARGRALRLRLLLDGLRARRAVPDARGLPARAARRRSPPTASRSSPARSTAAPRTTSTACRSRSAARSTPTAPARCPTTSRASPTPCPT